MKKRSYVSLQFFSNILDKFVEGPLLKTLVLSTVLTKCPSLNFGLFVSPLSWS